MRCCSFWRQRRIIENMVGYVQFHRFFLFCNIYFFHRWDGGHAYTCKSKHDGPISQVEVFEKFVFSRSQKGRTILSKWCLNTGSHVDSFSLPVLSDSSTCMQICREKFCLALGTGSGQVKIMSRKKLVKLCKIILGSHFGFYG